MTIFYLPDLGEGLAEAEIREWYVKEGDHVRVDQPLLSVETAKAVVDVPSPQDGCVLKLHGQAHDIIKTHAPLVEFASAEKGASLQRDQGSIVGRLEESPHALREEEVVVGTMAAVRPAVKVLPTVRALARQLQVDLSSVTPSGPQGQITAEDVKRQAERQGSQKAESGSALKAGEALHGVRRAMAQAMTRAQHEVALITLFDDADISHLPADADLTVLLLQAIAAASKAEPALNAWFDGRALQRQLFKEVNIGLAMDTAEGLFVPVFKDAGHCSAKVLREKINQFKESLRSRTIAPADLQGATISLSNFGMLAGKYATPMVVPPAVAILGCGRIHETMVVRAGKTEPGRVLPLSLSADHRAVTGGEAARFLAAILAFLKSPS